MTTTMMSAIIEKEKEDEERKSKQQQQQQQISPRSIVVPDVIQFQYDSEEEEDTPISNPHVRLHWNMDPEVSFSDWKIEISYEIQGEEGDGEEVTTRTKLYHVHKSVLAVGARRSEYFARLFHHTNTVYAESRDCTSQIQLEPTAAESFGAVLDYLYCPERRLSVTSETAAALHYLGSYFEMKQLRWDARQFWKEDLSVDTLSRYYRDALLYQDEKLLDSCIELCAKDISKINPEYSDILRVTEPSFWLQVLRKYNKDWPDYQSLHASKLMSQFCETYEAMDATTFNEIIDPANLPCIAPEVALAFISLEHKFFPDSTSQGVTELSDLQLRCVEALAFSWPCIDVCDEDTKNLLRNQCSPLFLAELFTRSLARAQVTNTLLQNQVKSLTGSKEMLEHKNARLKSRVNSSSSSSIVTTTVKHPTPQQRKDLASSIIMDQFDKAEVNSPVIFGASSNAELMKMTPPMTAQQQRKEMTARILDLSGSFSMMLPTTVTTTTAATPSTTTSTQQLRNEMTARILNLEEEVEEEVEVEEK